jgi:hypothetical protein
MPTFPVVIFALLGFRFLGGSENEQWYVDSAFESKAACFAHLKEILASEQIHRVRFECIPYATHKKPVPEKNSETLDMYKINSEHPQGH